MVKNSAREPPDSLQTLTECLCDDQKLPLLHDPVLTEHDLCFKAIPRYKAFVKDRKAQVEVGIKERDKAASEASIEEGRAEKIESDAEIAMERAEQSRQIAAEEEQEAKESQLKAAAAERQAEEKVNKAKNNQERGKYQQEQENHRQEKEKYRRIKWLKNKEEEREKNTRDDKRYLIELQKQEKIAFRAKKEQIQSEFPLENRKFLAKENQPIPINDEHEFAHLYLEEIYSILADCNILKLDMGAVVTILSKASCFSKEIR